ncbi:MAG: O-antigen ligase family protein [Actinomycetota bacterium]|nr:O-antigen ligase family protein [Actinomycetota bacterium]
MTHHHQHVLGAVSAVATAVGLVLQPRLTIGVLGAGLLLALAFLAPVANLVLIVLTTAVVPFSVQNQLSDPAPVILSDLLLLSALARTVLVIGRTPLTAAQRRVLLALALFLVVVTLQFVRGLMAGHDVGTTGFEFRTLFALSTFVIALPILAHERQRSRLLIGLLGTGVVLGLWGVVQWVLKLDFEVSYGVREGISGAPSGAGQLQGGLYAFPVAVVLAFAVLNSGRLKPGRARSAVLVLLALNVVSLLLTYERTFWIAAAVGVAFVVWRAGGESRLRAVTRSPLIALGAIGLLLTPWPNAVVAARERLVTLGDFRNDNSVRYRVAEAQHVFDEIKARPVQGEGLGATVTWARPWDQVPARKYHYSHNAYLWLAWKVGVPAAAVLWVVILYTIGRPRLLAGDVVFTALRDGAQAALLLLMLANVAFPSFNTYGITAVMGLLLALCVARNRPPDMAGRSSAGVAATAPI